MVGNSSEIFVSRRISDKNSDLKPILTVKYPWPFQRCEVVAECVSTRKLTLLEKYILRAFNEIKGVTAKEIAYQLGLFEPILLEKTIESLRDAQAINVNDSVEWEDNEENGQLKTWKDKIEEGHNKLEILKAEVTSRGKQNLSLGKIDNPPEDKIFLLYRSLIGGSLFPGEKNKNELKIEKIEASLLSYLKNDVFDNLTEALSDEDVINVIKDIGSLGQELEIRHQHLKIDEEAENDPIIYDYVYISVLVDQNNDYKWIVTDEKGNKNHLLTSEIRLQDKIHFDIMKDQPINKSMEIIDSPFDHEIYPLSLGMFKSFQTLSESKVIISNGRVPDAFNTSKHLYDKYQELLNIDKTHFYITESGKPFDEQKSLLISGDWFPEAALASDQGSFCFKTIPYHSDSGDDFPIIVCVKDNKIFEKTKERLFKELDNYGRYLLDPNINTYKEWITQDLNDTNISDIKSHIKKFVENREVENDDYDIILKQAIISKLKWYINRSKDDDDIVLLKIIDEISKIVNMNLWYELEIIYQQKILTEFSVSNPMEVWINHQRNKFLLPFEDAAELENLLFNHCNDTFHRICLELESHVDQLSRDNRIEDYSFFKKVNGLLSKNILEEALANDLKSIWSIRNKYSHWNENEESSFEIISDYKNTMIAIRTGRILHNKYPSSKSEVWLEPQENEWDNEISATDFNHLFSSIIEFINLINKSNLSINGDNWLGILLKSYPKEIVGIDENILKSIRKMPDPDIGMTKDDFIEKIAMKMIDGISFKNRYTHMDNNILFTKETEKDIKLLEKMELDDVIKYYLTSILNEIPLPRTISELEQQLELISPWTNILGSNADYRWNKALEAKEFKSSWKYLLSYVKKVHDKQGEGFANKVRERLLVVSLEDYFRNSTKISWPIIMNLGQETEKIIIDQEWRSTIIKKSGWIGHTIDYHIKKLDEEEKKMIYEKIKENEGKIFPTDLERINKRLMEMANKGS